MIPGFRRAQRRSATAVAVLLAVVAIVAVPSAAAGQRVGGSIGVSLTVLEPMATRAVEVTGFRMDRDGLATLETTAPTAAQASQLVMVRVASSANGFVPVHQAPVVVRGARGASVLDEPAQRLSYRVPVGRSASDARRDVQLRIEYLAVAGT